MSEDRHRHGASGSGNAVMEPQAGPRTGPGGVHVHVSDDSLSVLLDCADPLKDLDATVAAILAAFERLKIPEHPDAAMLADMLRADAAAGGPLVNQPLIEGYAAEPSQDGRLEWARDFFAEGWEEDAATGAIDFWAKLDNRGVTAGEWILKVHPPILGEPGLNVFGVKIPVTRPQKERMRCGKGVVQREDGAGIVWIEAAVSGRVRLNNGTLTVDDVYVIKGNLGLSTGNIHHPGTLQVEGDIEQGVTVEVGGDITVRGMVEPCNIKAGGNLSVAGGIVGQEGFRIEVGGGLQARYLRDVTIDAIGDINAGNEISHAFIRTLGRVLVPGGRLAGGTTIARGGITAGQAGAAGATGTLLVAGVDYLVEPRVARLEEDLARLETRRHLLPEEIARLQAAPTSEETDRALLDLGRELQGMPQAIEELKATISRLIDESEAACHPELAALQEVWSGITIQLGDEKMPVRASVRRPRLAKLLNGRVRLLPLGDGNMPDD